MLNLVFLILIIALNASSSYASRVSNDTKVCALFNEYYTNQYIYAVENKGAKRIGKRLIGPKSITNLFKPSEPGVTYRDRPAFIHLSVTNSKGKDFNLIDPVGHWKLKSVPNRPNTFIIKHSILGGYLFSSTARKDKHRRYIDTSITHNPGSTEFMWELRQPFVQKHHKLTNNDEQIFTIYNVFYNEPLYAAHKYYSEEIFYRSVFLWYSSPDSSKFNWIIKCQN